MAPPFWVLPRVIPEPTPTPTLAPEPGPLSSAAPEPTQSPDSPEPDDSPSPIPDEPLPDALVPVAEATNLLEDASSDADFQSASDESEQSPVESDDSPEDALARDSAPEEFAPQEPAPATSSASSASAGSEAPPAGAAPAPSPTPAALFPLASPPAQAEDAGLGGEPFGVWSVSAATGDVFPRRVEFVVAQAWLREGCDGGPCRPLALFHDGNSWTSLDLSAVASDEGGSTFAVLLPGPGTLMVGSERQGSAVGASIPKPAGWDPQPLDVADSAFPSGQSPHNDFTFVVGSLLGLLAAAGIRQVALRHTARRSRKPGHGARASAYRSALVERRAVAAREFSAAAAAWREAKRRGAASAHQARARSIFQAVAFNQIVAVP